MINAAVIGVSGFGRTHCEDLFREHEAGRLRFTAAVIHNDEVCPETLAHLKALKVELFTDYSTMLEKYAGRLDICCIPTGIALHRSMTEAALTAGANVFVEKPVAPVWKDAEAMIAAGRKAKRFVAVGYQSIYQPETRRIKELLLSGQLGRVKRLKCYALWPRQDVYYERNNWAGKIFSSSGTPILDAPFTNAVAHYLNLLLFYAGNSFDETADVQSIKAHLFRSYPIPSCDTADMRILCRDGREILFYASHAVSEKEGPVSVIECENGFVNYTRDETTVTDLTGNELARFESAGSECRINLWRSLCARLNGGSDFICSAELAAKAVLVGNGVFDAAPIVDLPASIMDVAADDEKHIQRSIRGMAQIIRKCCKENRLIDRNDFAYAVDSPVFDLTDYRGFRGRFYC